MKGYRPIACSETTLSLFPNKEISKGKMLSWTAEHTGEGLSDSSVSLGYTSEFQDTRL